MKDTECFFYSFAWCLSHDMPPDAGFLYSKVAMQWESIDQTSFGRGHLSDEGTEVLLTVSFQL
jgi:hypothetical protein